MRMSTPAVIPVNHAPWDCRLDGTYHDHCAHSLVLPSESLRFLLFPSCDGHHLCRGHWQGRTCAVGGVALYTVLIALPRARNASQNEPLYIKTFAAAESKQDTGLRFHYHV